MKTKQFVYLSPVGGLSVVFSENGLEELSFSKDEPSSDKYDKFAESTDSKFAKNIIRQLDEYFAGKRREFTIPLAISGSPFQESVWSELQQIPYGSVISYGDIAKKLNKPGASRAVGNANNKNKIAIIIPCHRVVASDRGLGGYAGGLGVKKTLLKLEGVQEYS